jgi:hypothetical protein
MKSSRTISRLMLLLAAAGWRRDEVNRVIHELRYSSDHEIDAVYSEIGSFKKYLIGSVEHRDEVFEAVATRPRVQSISTVSEVGRRVHKLLRDEAGMTNDEVVKAFKQHFRETDPSRARKIKPLSKKSLASWVDGLTDIYSPSEILHIATIIRNKRVHDGSLDWGLRKP